MSKSHGIVLLTALSLLVAIVPAYSVTWIKVNGQTSATINLGEPVVLTMDCTAGGEVFVVPVIDIDDDGIYEESDKILDAWFFVDNSWVDEDTRSGYYKETIPNADGLVVGRRFFLVAVELGATGRPYCTVLTQPVTTSQGISGRVTQANGLPVQGITVGALPAENVCLDETDERIFCTRTDVNGDYVIYTPSAGNYIVAVFPNFDTDEGPSCYKEVTVSAGGFRTGFDFQMKPELPECSVGIRYLVTGTVKDALGRPLPGALVSTGDVNTRTNMQGYYEMRVPGGPLNFRLELDGYVPDQQYSLDVTADTTLNMTMHRAAYRVQGTVRRSSDNQPLACAKTKISTAGGSYYQNYDETNAAGRYLLWTDAGTGFYIAANMTLGSYDVYRATIDVTGNKTYDMVVPNRNATLTGTIKDGSGQPLAWAEIVARNKTRPLGKTITSLSKQDGTYMIKVTPGDSYTISFSKPGYDNPLGDYSLSPLSAGQTFTLNRTLDFISHPPVLCDGQVSPQSGPSGATFTFKVTYSDPDNDPPYGVFLDLDGAYFMMTAENPSDYNFVDGATFVYSTTLSPGPHQFSFGGSDNTGVEAERCVCEPHNFDGPCVYAPPVNVGFHPSSGTAPTNVWIDASAMWTDADGFANISKCYILTNTTLSGTNAAYLMYDQNQNKIYIRNDAGTAWLGGYAPGSSKVIENSYFKVDCAATTVNAAEDYVQLSVRVWFKSVMVGKTCSVWLKVEDEYGLTDGWDKMATLTMGVPPVNVSLTPSAGSFAPSTWQTLSSKYYDLDGYANIRDCYLLINSTTSQTNAVLVRYDSVNNLLYMRNDANSSWLGGYAPGSANYIENTRGKLDCASTTVSKSGQTVTVNWKLMFKETTSGKTYPAWMLVYDKQGNRDGYEQVGTVTINRPPTNVSISPNTGTLTGTKIAFTAKYSDPDGYQNLANCYLLINTTLSQVNAAFVRYDQNANLLYLKNDADTSWGTGRAPGSAYVLENSYCKLYCAETTVSGSGTTLTVTWKLEFKPTMSGRAVQEYMLVFDDLGARDGYDQVGSVTLNRMPVNVSLSPTTGPFAVGVKQTFTTKYSDGDGFGHLANCYLLFNTTLSQVSAAFVRYDANANLLYVRDDANTTWGTGYSPGSAVVLQNSQCKLYCAETTVSGSGTTLTVNWKIEFKSSLSKKTCGAWMLVYDDLGGRDGYDQMASGMAISQLPSNESLTPHSGTLNVGVPTTLTSVFSDKDGFADIRDCYLLMNTTLSQVNALLVRYDAQNNLLYIKDDTNSTWVGGVAPGSSETLENSQGILYASDTTVVKTGSTITVTWAVEVKSVFAGLTCPVWMLVYDKAGLREGWKQMGSFSVR